MRNKKGRVVAMIGKVAMRRRAAAADAAGALEETVDDRITTELRRHGSRSGAELIAALVDVNAADVIERAVVLFRTGVIGITPERTFTLKARR